LVACLAVRHRLCSAARVARHFGKAKSTLSEQMATCRQRPANAQLLSTPTWQILAQFHALGHSKRER